MRNCTRRDAAFHRVVFVRERIGHGTVYRRRASVSPAVPCVLPLPARAPPQPVALVLLEQAGVLARHRRAFLRDRFAARDIRLVRAGAWCLRARPYGERTFGAGTVPVTESGDRVWARPDPFREPQPMCEFLQ